MDKTARLKYVDNTVSAEMPLHWGLKEKDDAWVSIIIDPGTNDKVELAADKPVMAIELLLRGKPMLSLPLKYFGIYTPVNSGDSVTFF